MPGHHVAIFRCRLCENLVISHHLYYILQLYYIVVIGPVWTRSTKRYFFHLCTENENGTCKHCYDL